MKMDRLISIIMLLLERKTISAKELSNIFKVSTRTIYRDIDTLGEAGIPIITYPGAGGGIGIIEEYKFDKRLFTTSDIISLLIGLDGINSALSGKEISSTLAKIQGMIPEDKLSEIEFYKNQMAIDLTPWKKDDNIYEKLNLIKTALSESKTLEFDYINIYGNPTNREVEPYRLLHKNSSWYLQGYCLLRNEFRTFKFYRIDNIKLTSNVFTMRNFESSVFDTSSAPDQMIEISLRFSETIKKHLEEYFDSITITACCDGICTANVMIFDNEQSYNSLLLFGDKCECLEPFKIREYIFKKAIDISKMHKI